MNITARGPPKMAIIQVTQNNMTMLGKRFREGG